MKGDCMRFRSDVYDKLYPRPKRKEVVESNVDTFKPTEQEVAEVDAEAEVTEVDEVEEVEEVEAEAESEVSDE